MIRKPTYYSIFEENDFKKYMVQGTNTIGNVPVSDEPAINQWSFQTALQAAKINVDNTKAAYTIIKLGQLDVGDIIEVDCEIMNLSGNKAVIKVDWSDSENMYSVTNMYSRTTKSDTGFSINSVKTPINKKGFYRVTIGLSVSEAGIFLMRKVIMKIQKGKIDDVKEVARFRGEFHKDASGSVLQRTDFVNDPCSIVIETGNTISITFPQSLGGSALRPIAFVSNEYYIINNNYMARCSYATRNGVKVQFFALNPHSNIPVNIADLPIGTHFSLLVEN